ncbi:MAG: lactate utilization protein [Sphaerochaetaceae bacterium]
MDINTDRVRELQVARTIENLQRNNMEAAFLPKTSDVVPMLRYLLEEDSIIALGGSSSLNESGALKLVRSDTYRLLDRYEPNITKEELHNRLRASFTADVLLTSVNAITEHGELYCHDGTSNRTAAMLFGPKKVIVIAGIQKIVPTLRDAVNRVKRFAAPANAIRIGKDTHCVKHGYCVAPFCDDQNLMSIPAGECENTICSNMVVFGRQIVKGRISVYIVGEELGY